MQTESNPVLARHNVNVRGAGDRTMVFAHGFGCDQTMWEPVARNLERDIRIGLLDLLGPGPTDLSANYRVH